MTTYNVIGKKAARKDGPAKVTGKAKFAYDVALPGMLHAKSVRSPLPYARIVKIDISKALALPGVHAVLTGADIAGHVYGNRVRDVPVLANGVVRFIGEKVAAVVADDEPTAERGRDLVEVEYEEFDGIFTIDDAMAASAPVLHPDMLGYQGFMKPPAEPSNIFFTNVYGVGDIEAGFAEADQVFEDTYSTQRQHPAFFEPRACVVVADLDGRVQIWTSTKAPYGLKGAISLAIGVDNEKLLINPTYVGGDFGGKGCPWDEPLAYFLSVKTGRPVKMVMDYQEEFEAGNPRHASFIRVRTGVRNDGTITAHHQDMIFNSGAYAGLMPLGFLAGADRIAANWKIDNARFDHRQVYTNTVPGGYMRGPGEVQGSFAMESHLDEVARKLGMDIVDFRLRNILHPGDATPMNEHFSGVRAEETLRAAVAKVGLPRAKNPNVGFGISMSSRPAGGGETHVEITVEQEGSILLRTPIFEQGSGVHTVLAIIAAEELGTTVDNIRVVPWNTDAVENDSGIAGSRGTRMMIPAAHEASIQARGELLNTAAELTGWPIEKLESKDGAVVNTESGEQIGWADLLGRVPGRPVMGRASNKDMSLAEYTTFGAQIAEVEVDPETGQIHLRRFLSAHDVGTIMNPIGHQGQINGSIVTGLGYALMEELQFDAGRVTTQSFADVKIPTMADLPEFETLLLPSDEGVGPYNVRSIGEAPLLGVAPAIANAIRDATGIRFHDLPLTAEKILAGLREKNAAG
jgi:xanthine dehydrogenase molybdenum-binding subunit